MGGKDWLTYLLVLVAVLAGLTIFSLLISPDTTPHANEGSVLIQKKLPGYTTTILKVKKNVATDQPSLLEKIWYGTTPDYLFIPVDSFFLEGWDVVFFPAGIVEARRMTLADACFSLGSQLNYEEDIVRFTDIRGNQEMWSRQYLILHFNANVPDQRFYLLGTDRSGRDMWSRLLRGARISLGIGIAATLIATVLGLVIGAISGYYGGWIDRLFSWLMSVTWSIPAILLIVAISITIQQRTMWLIILAVGLTMWVETAREIRARILLIKQMPYIDAARMIGLNDRKIIISHIMPNLYGPVILLAIANLANTILLESGLSFLGLSLPPPAPTWGSMVFEGFNAIGSRNSWHLILFPSLAISVTILIFNIAGQQIKRRLERGIIR